MDDPTPKPRSGKSPKSLKQHEIMQESSQHLVIDNARVQRNLQAPAAQLWALVL
jgi:hypothetical protein